MLEPDQVEGLCGQLSVDKIMIFLSLTGKKIVGIGENADYLLFPIPTMFSKSLCCRILKTLDCVLQDSKLEAKIW